MDRRSNLTVALVVAFVAMTGQAFAQSTPLVQSTDRATGAVVKIYRTATGPRLEVQSASVSLTKHIGQGGVIVTTLGDGKESLRIEASETRMVVSSTRGNATAAAGDQAAAERVRALVAKSPLTKRAATLIGRMGFGDASPVQPLLLTTRAFLLAAAKDGSGMTDLKNWMKNSRSRAQVVTVSLPMGAQKSSSQCWKEYGDEILAAYDDFLDCFNHIKWWDPFFPVQRCEVVYEARILAAFGGWMNCLGVIEPAGN
jgi:hypothetical protein